MLLVLTAVYWGVGLLQPELVPEYASSRREVTGMALLLITVPSYLVAAVMAAQNYTLRALDQIRPLLPDPSHATTAAESIASGFHRSWLFGGAFGFVMGLANVPTLFALSESAMPAIDISMALGQIGMWMIVGIVLTMRFHTARVVNDLGSKVRFKLFALEPLRPLARIGLADVLVIAGALVLMPLQALDAQFRIYNYTFGTSVGVMAGSVLLLWPLAALHRRIRDEKKNRLAALNQSDAQLDVPKTAQDFALLESLLSHRGRIRSHKTWLLDTGILSRVLFYLVIPPLAWVGAALVELMLDRFFLS
ncbi:MAG: hypothetical protein V3T64_12665 [Myxococcota bacterium]